MEGYSMSEVLCSRLIDQFVPAINGFMHIAFGGLLYHFALCKK